MNITLRDYQKECLDIINSLQSGSYIIRLATGLGKTVIFTNIKRKGKVLVLAHREELIRQPIKYYDCPVGIEMASEKSNGEPVVIASVQTLVRRLDKFDPWEFDMIITDEAHHAAARSYQKIYDYFVPRLHLGFTATPNRGDGARLDNIYQDIIFDRDLKWGIQQGYLSDIHCLRVNIGYDLSKVARRMGDFATGELENAMNIESHNKAIAEAYYKYAKGQTLIFATSVQHAQDIAKEIPGAVAVTGDTKSRAEIIDAFTRREIPVLVNCMIFTEGTDIPLVETIIIARPTQNSSLYTQMVGRGLRLHPDKEKLILIDCVGVTGKCDICTAPTLIGVDLDQVPKSKRDEIEGDLFDLPEIIAKESDCPESWIRNTEIVNLWAREQGYTTHNINFFKMPNGDLIVSLPERNTFRIPAQNELGMTIYNGEKMSMQKAIDTVYKELNEKYYEYRAIWDLNIVSKWGRNPATEKQLNLLRRRKIDIPEGLTAGQASMILNRIMNGRKAG